MRENKAEKKSEKKDPDSMENLSQEAKKDFVIFFNNYRKEMKKGKPIGKIPSKFVANLKTEGVI